MKTLIKPQSKLKILSFDNSYKQVDEKLVYTRIGFDFKFYQKLFLILLTSCIFLIFPESPQDSDALCKKYHSNEACAIW